MARSIITEEGKSWLISQDPSLSYKELTAMYNQKFGTNFTWRSIVSFFRRNTDISRTSNGGRFTEGHDPYSKRPIGSEHVTGNRIWIKVTEDKPEHCKTKLELYKHQWRLKHRVIWEEVHGPIENGAFVIFLDRDPMNCTLDNLYLVTKRVNAIMNKNRWFAIEDPVIFKTALRCAELISIVTERRQ